jgi:hypothetical protein
MILAPLKNIAVHIGKAKCIGYIKLIYSGRFSPVFASWTIGIGGGAMVVSQL